jgi:hypothetical protein
MPDLRGREWSGVLRPLEFPPAASNENGMRQTDVDRTRRHQGKSAPPNPSLNCRACPKTNLGEAPERGWKPARSALRRVIRWFTSLIFLGGWFVFVLLVAHRFPLFPSYGEGAHSSIFRHDDVYLHFAMRRLGAMIFSNAHTL